jgi:hypothetical protein
MKARSRADWRAESVWPVELAVREGDGLEVTLWWSRRTGSIWVDVRERSGRAWAVEAPPERALDAFYDPFAYRTDDVGLDDVPLVA